MTGFKSVILRGFISLDKKIKALFMTLTSDCEFQCGLLSEKIIQYSSNNDYCCTVKSSLHTIMNSLSEVSDLQNTSERMNSFFHYYWIGI